MTVKELINKLLDRDMNQEVIAYLSMDKGASWRDVDFRIKETKWALRTYTGIEFEDDELELVTRCCECKYHEGHECMRNKMANVHVIVDETDYCSWGDWKECDSGDDEIN